MIELAGCDSTFREPLQLKIDIDEKEYGCDVTECFVTSRSSKITRKTAKRSAPVRFVPFPIYTLHYTGSCIEVVIHVSADRKLWYEMNVPQDGRVFPTPKKHKAYIFPILSSSCLPPRPQSTILNEFQSSIVVLYYVVAFHPGGYEASFISLPLPYIP